MKLVEHSKIGRTIGVLGQTWRATVTAAGDVYRLSDSESADSESADSEPIRWFVAADDRWHIPANEVAVRQRSIDGAPVLETRVRIPGGDAIQRVWVGSGSRGASALMMEFENDSPMAIAIAVSRKGLMVSRPVAVRSEPGQWSAPGLELAQDPTVIPIGHRTSVRVGLAISPSNSSSATTANITDFADWTAVARGWVAVSDRASSFTLPDLVDGVAIADVIVAERTEIALNMPDVDWRNLESLLRWLECQRELVRMGLREVDAIEVAGAIETLAKASTRRKFFRPIAGDMTLSKFLMGMRSAAFLLGPSQPRAIDDLTKVVARVTGMKNTSLAVMLASGDGAVTSASITVDVENDVARMGADGSIVLLPAGIASQRLGASFEVHGVAVGYEHRISFAVRWHGENAAILWEVEGPTIRLRSGVDHTWQTSRPSGEALWKVAGVPQMAPAVTDGLSFS